MAPPRCASWHTPRRLRTAGGLAARPTGGDPRGLLSESDYRKDGGHRKDERIATPLAAWAWRLYCKSVASHGSCVI
eukprot:8928322-Pyramimonas_sp.AAC.1